jgi:Tol biopolymer transport system component
MTSRRRLGVAAAGWFAIAVTVVPAIAAVTREGARGLPGGGPAAPIAISLEPGVNARVSVNNDGSQLLGIASDEAAVSPDGRWVTYRASPVGANTRSDGVMLADRAAGTTTQVFPATTAPVVGTLDGPVGPVAVEEPSVSADGSLVAFGLASGNQTPTIILWRRGTGLTFPLGGALTGDVPGLGYLKLSALHHPRLSADGSALVFQSDGYTPFATLAVVTPLRAGVYALELATGQVDVVSAPNGSSTPGPGGGKFGSLAVSDDGSVVAFASTQYLGSVNTFGRFVLPMQVWRRDRSSLTTTLVSATNGVPAAGTSDHPALSSDGSVIAFESDAANLVPNDGNGTTDVFAWTADSGVRRVSTAPDGTEANDSSAWPAVSADGTSIAFASRASNLVPGDTNADPFTQTDRAAPYDIFVAGPGTDRLARVTVGVGQTEADDSSLRPSLALGARLVFFESLATNLVRGDTNGNSDIFVRDRRPPQPPPSPPPSPTPTPAPIVKPAIIVSPNPVDFGSVPIGTLGVSRSATILSVGTGPSEIGSIAISGINAGDFLLSANPCTGTSLAPGASCVLGILFIGTATGTRTAILSVASSAGPPETVPLVAAVGVGILRLDPATGPTGIVTIATGTGFPANAPVVLTWSVGITPAPLQPIFTDANGGFTAQVLVLPKDREGPRTLSAVATLSGVPATPATAPFLVVTGTAAPPVSGLIQVFRDSFGQPIILRR